MPQFVPGTVEETDQPVVEVEVDLASPISTGPHRFQLEVIDDSGNVSDPVVVSITIADTQRPTAVLEAPAVVEFGNPFTLVGRSSRDVSPFLP